MVHIGSMANIYYQTFKIRAAEVDQKKQLRWDAFAAYMQEVAWEHANRLKVGKQFFDENKFWVLSRLQIKIERFPVWGDEVVLSTWPKGIDKLFALRDFEMKTREGEILLSATSAWLILQADTKRPIRPDSILAKLNPVAHLEAIEGTADKININSFTTSRHSITRTARASDLDMNGHVNNVTYLRWAIDYIHETEVISSLPIHKMAINYLSETFFHEPISISIASESMQSIVIAGISCRDQRKVFAIKVN